MDPKEMTEEEKMDFMEKSLQPFAFELKKNILQTIYDINIGVAKEYIEQEQNFIEQKVDDENYAEKVQHLNGVYGGLLISCSILVDIASSDDIELQRNMLEEKLVFKKDIEEEEESKEEPKEEPKE